MARRALRLFRRSPLSFWQFFVFVQEAHKNRGKWEVALGPTWGTTMSLIPRRPGLEDAQKTVHPEQTRDGPRPVWGSGPCPAVMALRSAAPVSCAAGWDLGAGLSRALHLPQMEW